MSATEQEPDGYAPELSPEPKPFRFKQREDSLPDGSRSQDAEEMSSKRQHRHRHRRHHHGRHKRRRLSNDTADRGETLPPDVAFRESLFDAMGDDEGAEFWQSVYGQPIHNYPRTYTDIESGELETMDDEQYASYVRRKMWERSIEGIEAAREARRRADQEETKNRRQTRSSGRTSGQEEAHNNFAFDFELEASLKRGQQRKDRKRWRQIWLNYVQSWKDLQDIRDSGKEHSADDVEQMFLRNKIAWPTETGDRTSVSPENIEKFIHAVSDATQDNEHDYDTTKASILKTERFKWHPDKMQQKFATAQLDQSTMENVTAVFQVLDGLWNDLRKRGGAAAKH